MMKDNKSIIESLELMGYDVLFCIAPRPYVLVRDNEYTALIAYVGTPSAKDIVKAFKWQKAKYFNQKVGE